MDRLGLRGIYRIATIPEEWGLEDFKYWWCDERDERGRFVHEARMSRAEKERYYIAEFGNMILAAGLNEVGQYLTATSASPILAQYFAVGNGVISLVQANDSLLANEFFRKAPTGASNSGNLATVSTALLAGDATGQWTNMGIFGITATASANTGVLISQALTTFLKPSSPFTVDWLVQLFGN